MSLTKPFLNQYARKENYQTMNYPNHISPHRNHYNTQDPSPAKRTLQQKQIQDLEHKVDIILQHNDKLSFQNQQLKRCLAQLQMQGLTNLQKDRLSRYQMQDNQYGVRKLKSQLQILQRQNQMLICQNTSIKQINKKQIESLRVIISNLNLNNEQLKLQNIKIIQEMNKIKQIHENQKKFAIKQLQRKFQQNLLILQKQKAQSLANQRLSHTKSLQELKQKSQHEKCQLNRRKATLINKLQQTHNKQINQLREQMLSQFKIQLSKKQQDCITRCKQQRDKADSFIKQMMNNLQGNNLQQNQLLKKQIRGLQNSLINRKKLIDQLLKNHNEQQITLLQFQEIKQLRKRLKQQTEHYMRQNQILKIRSAQKYQNDFKEMIKIYQNKIQILTEENKIAHEQNQRIRKSYQDQIQLKIRLRRSWQQDTGKLKNLIRKLKVELQGVQDQFRINIDFIKDQNATFSLTMMKSVAIDKDKANFFQEENRKLRTMYEKHEQDVQLQKKQALEKINYYQSKYEALKKLMENQKLQLAEKEDTFQKILDARQETIRQNLRKQRFIMENRLTQMENERLKFERECFDARNKLQECQSQLKEVKSQLQYYTAKLNENEGHIQRLRMQLQMAGVDDREKDEAINQWKQHYQKIIANLQSDKADLRGINEAYSSKLEKLVYKYQLLQQQLKKGNELMKRRGDLDKRVIQLGLDENLIKNMSEIWKKDISFQ